MAKHIKYKHESTQERNIKHEYYTYIYIYIYIYKMILDRYAITKKIRSIIY